MRTLFRIYTVAPLASGATYTLMGTDLPEYPGHKALADLISPLLNCTFLAHVYGLVNGKERDLIYDADGANKRLPRNEPAWEFYQAWFNRRWNAHPAAPERLLGKVVIFERKVWPSGGAETHSE